MNTISSTDFSSGLFATIDLQQLQNNARSVRSALEPKSQLMAVVKANAYGHGISEASRAFLLGGAEQLCVDTAEEAFTLRDAGIEKPILCFGAVSLEHFAALKNQNVHITLASLDDISRLAQSLTHPPFHLKIDTGLHRGGFASSDLEIVLAQLKLFELIPFGLYTDFLEDDDGAGAEYTAAQIGEFNKVAKRLRHEFPALFVHPLKGALAINNVGSNSNGARVGALLYGFRPKNLSADLQLKPAIQLSCDVVGLTTIKPGMPIGYGASIIAKDSMILGHLGIGYSHGFYPGSITGVHIDDQFAPVVGPICMNQMSVDVTNIQTRALGSKATIPLSGFLGGDPNGLEWWNLAQLSFARVEKS